MGFFSKNQNLSLQLFMDFNVTSGIGNASIKFELLNPIQNVSESLLYLCLSSLYYGRILYAHKKTRSKLFYIIDNAADEMVNGNREFDFENWSLNIYNKEMYIWPWTISNNTDLPKAKIYKAILEGSNIDNLSLKLKMALGPTDILAPASVLILIYNLSGMLDDAGVQSLGKFLKGMNRFYGTPDNANNPSSEIRALNSVLKSLIIN